MTVIGDNSMNSFSVNRYRRRTSRIINVVMFVFVITSILFFGCNLISSDEENINLRLSNGLALSTFQNSVLIPDFIKEVKEKSNGRIKIENYPASSLFGHIETADALHRGVVDMGFCSLNHFVGYSPVMAFNDYAFLVPDVDSWKKNYDETFKIAEQILNKFGVKLLAFLPYSSTCIISRKPINKPADCKGLRIRGISDPFFDCIKSWGGVPAAMNPSETYDAMAKGSLDGIMSGWDSVKSRKYFEIAGYVIGPTASPIWGYVINLKTWNRLPKDIQQIVQLAAINSSQKGMEGQVIYDEEIRNFLREHNIQIKVFTPEETEIWKKATRPAYDLYLKRCANKGEEEVAERLLEIYK
jgi:TRAP-type C4-dicarboxylate transport system substrate-binding protein